jgi:hypothetical protein
VISLEVENFKRVRAISLSPNAGVTTVSGRNGQGKSSTLDAIEAALGGKNSIPSKPIRKGAESARIVVETTDYVVTRVFKGDGSTLTVKSKDGAKYGSPQSMLDALLGDLSFDPLAFTGYEPKRQSEILRRLAGLDFSGLDADRAKAFDSRTVVNREVKRLEGELAGIAKYDDAPDAEVSSADLIADLRDANAAHADVQRMFADADASRSEARRLNERSGAGLVEIERLRAEIVERQNQIAKYEAACAKMTSEATDHDNAGREKEAKAEAAASLLPDVAAVEARIAGADAINAKVRSNARHAETKAELAKRREQAEAMTVAIAAADAAKAKALAEAKFPLAGLSIDDDGVTLDGLPFDQASQAEQLRASISIGAALHPNLGLMLVRQGAFLDDDALALVAKVAEDEGLQIIVERVGKGDSLGVVIEDGEIVASAEAAE